MTCARYLLIGEKRSARFYALLGPTVCLKRSREEKLDEWSGTPCSVSSRRTIQQTRGWINWLHQGHVTYIHRNSDHRAAHAEDLSQVRSMVSCATMAMGTLGMLQAPQRTVTSRCTNINQKFNSKNKRSPPQRAAHGQVSFALCLRDLRSLNETESPFYGLGTTVA